MSSPITVLETIAACRAYRASLGSSPVAFVPTMGALHDGHASLVRAARRIVGQRGHVIASVFVNPTQFGPNEDFNKYPRTLAADLALLQAASANAVFTPTNDIMYPPTADPTSRMSIDPGPLAHVLEGAIRPGHFRGVCTVVAKLLNIVEPDKLVMGQKDYQQNAVLRQMIRDLNIPTEHVMEPTIREADGLAMSSRNRYLTPEERSRAVVLFEALSWAAAQFAGGIRSPETLAAGMKQRIEARGLIVQYALPAHADTLAPWHERISGPCVLLIAAQLGKTRLIDNMVL